MTDSCLAWILDRQAVSEQLAAQGRFAEALSACEEALRLVEELDGSSSPDVANLLCERADLLHKLARYGEAEQDASRACAILAPLASLLPSPDGKRLQLRALGLHGALLRELGHYAAAERLLRAAVVLAEAAFGESDAALAGALNDLGVLFKYQGVFGEAERVYLHALHIVESSGCPDPMLRATLYHNLGGLEHARGNYEGGEPWARLAVEIRRALCGDEHLATLADAAAHAAILDGLGRHEESEPLYRSVLAHYERIFGPAHYEVAVNLNNLAALLHATGRTQESEVMYRRSLQIKEELFGGSHIEVALSRYNLGLLLSELGQDEEARELHRSALAVFENTLPAAHPWVQNCRRSAPAVRSGSDARI